MYNIDDWIGLYFFYCFINNIGYWCIVWCLICLIYGNKNCKEGVFKFDILDICKI